LRAQWLNWGLLLSNPGRTPLEESRKNPIGRIQEEPQVSQALNFKNNLMNGVPYPMKKKEFSKFRDLTKM